MGDVHGDIEAFAVCLQMAGLVDDNGDWAGGTTVLVQVKCLHKSSHEMVTTGSVITLLINSAFIHAAST
jgi:hypothetical protein